MVSENERLENRVRRREYYQRNREKLIAIQMEYYHTHRDEILAKNKERYRKRMNEETPRERERRLEIEKALRKFKKWGNKTVSLRLCQ